MATPNRRTVYRLWILRDINRNTASSSAKKTNLLLCASCSPMLSVIKRHFVTLHIIPSAHVCTRWFFFTVQWISAFFYIKKFVFRCISNHLRINLWTRFQIISPQFYTLLNKYKLFVFKRHRILFFLTLSSTYVYS